MVTFTVADAFRAAADPTRRQIVELVAGRGRAVAQIAERFPMSRPAISKHLRILRRAGLVREEKNGRSRIYRADPEALEEIARWAQSQAGRAAARGAGEGEGRVGEAPEVPGRVAVHESPPPATPGEEDWRSW